MLERTEMLPRVGRVDVHDHICWVFASDDEHRSVVTSFLGAGLARNERVMFLGSPPARSRRVVGYLKAAGLDVEALSVSGQLIVSAAEDEYLRDGRFDPAARLHGYEANVRRALAEGFAGFRVAAEVTWLLTNPAARQDWSGYEFRADLLAARLPFAALCAYDGRQWQPGELAPLQAMHNRNVHLSSADPSAGFRLHGQRDGSIRLSGELDAAYGEQVRRVLNKGASHAAQPVLDIGELRFVDLSGMRAIAAACQAMVKIAGRATIRGASPTFRKVWRLAGFDQLDPAIMVE